MPDRINGKHINHATLSEIQWVDCAQCLIISQDGIQASRGTSLNEQVAHGEPFRQAIVELCRAEDANLPTAHLLYVRPQTR